MVVPDEFLKETKNHLDYIKNKTINLRDKINSIFNIAPRSNRKDFALWVLKNYKDLATYLFATFDRKPILPLIYKIGFKKELDKYKIKEEQ